MSPTWRYRRILCCDVSALTSHTRAAPIAAGRPTRDAISDPPPVQPPPVSPGVYARTGKVGDFAIKPHVMHFGGFEVGKVYTRRFTVTNAGRKSQRLQILEPTSEYFAVRWEGKGSLAPGMSDTVRVDFCADDLRYYYDCVRIRAGRDENAILPMHAYPTPNETKFPKHIDFGLCALGSTQTKTVKLSCKVPIAFEFELRLSTESKAFEVSPRSGEIPANGEVEIVVSYTPRRLHTNTMTIEVFTGEFGGNTRPSACQVRGTGFPSVARDKGVRALAGVTDGGPVDAGRLAEGTAQHPSVRGVEDSSSSIGVSGGPTVGLDRFYASGRFGPGGGAGGGDAYTEYVRRVASKQHRQPPRGEKTGAGPRHRKLSKTLDSGRSSTLRVRDDPFDVSVEEDGEEDDGEEDVDGVFVPRRISGHGDVQYVLGQRKGKLRAKELREAVAIRESQSKTVRASLAGLALAAVEPSSSGEVREEGSSSGVFNFKHAVRDVQRAQTSTKGAPNAVFRALDDPNLDPRVKDLIFEKEFERVRQYERVKDVTGCVAIGGDVLDPGDEAVVRLRREGRAAALNYYEISAAMARVSAGHETTLGASYEVVAGEPVALTGVAEPDYNENANDVWRMRRETLDRFVQAGRKVIIRNRAERRLRGIRALMATIGDKSRASAHVAKELMSGAGSGPGEDAELLEICKISEDRVVDFRFPVLIDSAFREWPTVDTSNARIGDFETLEPVPLIEPVEWRLKGHALDGAATFTPLHGDGFQPRLSSQPLYQGAEEEQGWDAIAARGVLDPDDVDSPPSHPGRGVGGCGRDAASPGVEADDDPRVAARGLRRLGRRADGVGGGSPRGGSTRDLRLPGLPHAGARRLQRARGAVVGEGFFRRIFRLASAVSVGRVGSSTRRVAAARPSARAHVRPVTRGPDDGRGRRGFRRDRNAGTPAGGDADDGVDSRRVLRAGGFGASRRGTGRGARRRGSARRGGRRGGGRRGRGGRGAHGTRAQDAGHGRRARRAQGGVAGEAEETDGGVQRPHRRPSIALGAGVTRGRVLGLMKKRLGFTSCAVAIYAYAAIWAVAPGGGSWPLTLVN